MNATTSSASGYVRSLGRFRVNVGPDEPQPLTVGIRPRRPFELVVPLEGKSVKVLADVESELITRPNYSVFINLYTKALYEASARLAAAKTAAAATESDDDDMFGGFVAAKRPRIQD